MTAPTQPPFDYLSENIFEAFCENVLEGVYEIASMKQIASIEQPGPAEEGGWFSGSGNARK